MEKEIEKLEKKEIDLIFPHYEFTFILLLEMTNLIDFSLYKIISNK